MPPFIGSRACSRREDPLYIARRLIRFASEDVGNADPQALTVAVAAKDAAHFIGMPEGNGAGAGGHLPRNRSEEQRGLHRTMQPPLTRTRRPPSRCASAQRADQAHETAWSTARGTSTRTMIPTP